MTAQQYVDEIAGRIKCSGKRRSEIKKELLSEINARIEDGMSPDDALSEMGTVSDVADSYNDNMPDAEKKRYALGRKLMILIPIGIFIAFFVCAVIFVIPRQKDISDSRCFSEEEVLSRLQNDIGLLNDGEYETLRSEAIEAMSTALKDGLMDSIQKQTGRDWGDFVSFGECRIVEVIQAGQHYAVAEIKASYENMNVTYRITYDKDMKLAGLYVR